MPKAPVTLLLCLWLLKHMLDQRVKEVTVGVFSSETNCLANVLEVVSVAQLDASFGKVVEKGWFQSRCVVADDHLKGIPHGLEEPEQFQKGFPVLGGSQDSYGDVMFQKVEAVKKRDLPLISFDSDVLAVDIQDPTPAVAVVQGEARVVWQEIHLTQDPLERSRTRHPFFISKGTKRHSIKVTHPERFLLCTVVYSKTFSTSLTCIPIHSTTNSLLNGFL